MRDRRRELLERVTVHSVRSSYLLRRADEAEALSGPLGLAAECRAYGEWHCDRALRWLAVYERHALLHKRL